MARRKQSRTIRRYRLLGHEHVALTREQLEEMVRKGLLGGSAKIVRDGEGFAAALHCRQEFQHLFTGCEVVRPAPAIR